MYEPETNATTHKSGTGWKASLVAFASLYVLVTLFLLADMRERIGKLEAGQAATTNTLASTNQRLDSSEAAMRATADALAQRTTQDLQARTTELQRQTKATVSRLAKEQKAVIEGVRSEMGSVRSEVGNVRNEVGGVRTDVETTKTDLQATKEKLEHAIGDLGLQSGLIARTREDLETLRRKGERNYYEFTLLRNQGPTRVSTVSLQLRKVDAKRGKYTLNVLADDRSIEKKDRTMFEPLQFYTGRDRHLYEVVVFGVDKNKVIGYLSTPKELVAQAEPPANK